ncbi:MAG: type II secretion system F family protein [Gammaproteobacteria bacterium]|nr:type II secretion system F family protein [Gammaproteobacteria bacterium]
MDNLMTTINGWLLNPNSLRILFILLSGGAMLALGLGLSYVLLGSTDPVRRRLAANGPTADGDGRLRLTIQTLVGPVSEWVLPKSEVERSKLTKHLTYAGFRSPIALQVFYCIKVALVLILPAIVLVVAQWFPELPTSRLLLMMGMGAGLGLIAPSSVVDRMMENRLRTLRRAFPDALDLLVVCVEAGLGLSAAIQRVADELVVSHPELARELALVNAEVRAGVDRGHALRNLADRTGLDDIRGLVSLLIQTMRFGTSVADALRVYSEEFRDRRMQKAEEEAAKIGTKLIFPLVFCLFPAFFVVAIGPAVIRLIDVFGQLAK